MICWPAATPRPSLGSCTSAAWGSGNIQPCGIGHNSHALCTTCSYSSASSNAPAQGFIRSARQVWSVTAGIPPRGGDVCNVICSSHYISCSAANAGTPQPQLPGNRQQALTGIDSLPRSAGRQLPTGRPSWQRRQQQQREQQQRQNRQQRRKFAVNNPRQKHVFADCSTYQSVLETWQQLQQASQAAEPAEQQQQLWRPPVGSDDCVNLIDQLATISRSASSHGGVGSSSSFTEDQTLLQLLPLAYDMLDHYAGQQQGPAVPGTEDTALRPAELLRCISNLASLKYSQPARLAALLELRSAGRQGLSGLKMQQLSGLVAGLAKAGVRPSNAWLVALMQEAERRMPAANLPQLSHLLHGLVRMGVKPSASWLDSLQDQAVQRLIEQAVQCQVTQDHRMQQQRRQDVLPATTAEVPIQQSGPNNSSSHTTARTSAGCQLHDVAQLLSACAEARHRPKPQLSAALWGATVGSLGDADTAALVELLSALGELQLVPPRTWMQQYYSSTAVRLQQQGQYKPWQIAESMKALGQLVRAGMQCCSASDVQQQRQDLDVPAAGRPIDIEEPSAADRQQMDETSWECSQWVGTVLAAAQQQMSFFAARDLAALLSGLAALQLPLEQQQLQEILNEAQQKLSRLNTAGLAMLAKAAVQLEQQQRGQQQRRQPLLTDSWASALLQETAVKLPMFPADDLASLLIALAGLDMVRPSTIWLEAAAVQLHSKLTVLEAGTLIQVLDAFAALGHMPGQHWCDSALAAVESRIVELQFRDMLHLLRWLAATKCRVQPTFVAAVQWAVQQQQQQQAAGMSPAASSQSADSINENESEIKQCVRLLEQIIGDMRVESRPAASSN